MVIKSSFRAQYHHPDIVVSMDSNLELGASAIHAYFEDQIRQGAVFRSGETVQIGWMIVLLKADEHGDLDIWEPRFGAVPITWVRGANNTFRHFMVQKAVCEQIGVDPLFPMLRQSAVMSREFLAGRISRMSRESPEGKNSGWVFTGDSNVGVEGEVCSLFEIGGQHSEVIPFLALPVGASVIWADKRIHIEFRNSMIGSDWNEFLMRLLKR